jgi:hypothetical protein
MFCRPNTNSTNEGKRKKNVNTQIRIANISHRCTSEDIKDLFGFKVLFIIALSHILV